MSNGIASILPPDLLYLIEQMKHGDELVLADANFPAMAVSQRLARAEGPGVLALLKALLEVFPLDRLVERPAAVMQRVDRPDQPAPIWTDFQALLDASEGRNVSIERVERLAFCERARNAYGTVATGERALGSSLIIRKGVIV